MMTSYFLGCSSGWRVVMVSLLYVVVCMLVPAVRGQTDWIEKPENQMVPLGGTARFVCKPPQQDSGIVWTQGANVLFLNGRKMSAQVPDRYRLEDNFTLLINEVQKSDDGTYGCNVYDFGSASARLTVLLPPGQPSITANLAGDIFQEGQTVRFTCASTGGNPPPTITWMKNGVELYNADPAQTQGDVTQRTIVVTMDSSDHQANYSCFVYNTVNEPRPFVASKILAVQYIPIITFNPSSPYIVRLDQRANFTCQVDANPPVTSVTWEKDGVVLQGTSPLRLFNAFQRSDAGNYTCIASNSLNREDPARATISVDVVYPPVVSVGANPRVVRESSSLSIECTVDAKPPYVELKWMRYFPNGTQRQVGNDRFLQFSGLAREDAGNYSCLARNYLSQPTQMATGEAFVYIYVQYAPGPAEIAPVASINVGEPLVIRCLASPQGYPPARYRWRKNQAVQSQEESTFTISQTVLSDNAVYMCTPYNDVGEGAPDQVQVNVNEPPQLSQPIPEEISLRITDTRPFSVTCRGQGRPEPTIEWSKDSVRDLSTLTQYYEIDSDVTEKNTYSFEVTSTLYFRGYERDASPVPPGGRTALRIEDMGNYTCRVKSPAHPNIIPVSTLQLLVQFKPVLAQSFGKVAVTIGQTASLQCTAQSHPAPVFQWYRDGQQVDTSRPKYSVQMMALNNVTAAYKSILTITTIAAEDYGIYKCYVTNFLGNVSLEINVTRKSLPEAPVQLQTLNRTWESIHLKWEPGFDGGFPQQFQVHVQEAGASEQKFPPLSSGSATDYNVTGLWPSTKYEFSVVGKNELGFGKHSVTILAYTRDLEIPTLGDAVPVFDTANNQLQIGAQPSSQYCLRIDVKAGGSWKNEKECTKLIGSAMEISKTGVTAVNVSVCLVSRPEVCGTPTSAVVSSPDNTPTLTVRDVIIIACVCAAIIITLLIILICFICKRRRANAKDYYSSPAGHQPTANGGVPGMKPQGHPQQQGSYDNPDHGLQLGLSGNEPPSYWNYNSQGLYGTRNDMSFDSQDRQMFENELNRRNDMMIYGRADGYRGTQESISMHGRPQSPSKGKFIDLDKDPSLQSQESGYSNGDPNKPKKVIYEVVV